MENGCDYNDLSKHDLEVTAMIRKDDPGLMEQWALRGGNVLRPLQSRLNSVLHIAAYMASNRIVSALIAQSADIDIRNESGKTPLMSASQFGHLDTIKLLVKAGADVNAVDANGATALHWASTLNDNVEIVTYLCAAGAGPSIQDSSGLTPLDYAMRLNRSLISSALSACPLLRS